MAFHRQQSRCSERRSVVVTGAGVITAMGNGWASNAAGFRSGRPALREITLFDTRRQRARHGGEADLPAELPPTALSSRRQCRLDRASRLLLHALSEALAQAGWGNEERRSQVPLIFGTSAAGMALGEAYFKQAVQQPGRRTGQAARVQLYQAQNQILTLCRALELEGPITVISNACASGANAIGHAFHLIKHGFAERAVCGGYDALCHLVFAGFDSLHALSPTRPRPFDAARDGLALGEGAGVLVLESETSAQARAASVLARITGYGCATDIHHLTQPHPEGLAALESMRRACREAELTPDRIDYLNAHGTGTLLNDRAESLAIAAWAGESAARVPVSSSKGAIGHLLGGAGAVEAIISLMALREQWLPPNLNVDTPDPLCRFDLVRETRETAVQRVMTNSFGFGGANATLILERP